MFSSFFPYFSLLWEVCPDDIQFKQDFYPNQEIYKDKFIKLWYTKRKMHGGTHYGNFESNKRKF